jgi:hypothetical protein
MPIFIKNREGRIGRCHFIHQLKNFDSFSYSFEKKAVPHLIFNFEVTKRHEIFFKTFFYHFIEIGKKFHILEKYFKNNNLCIIQKMCPFLFINFFKTKKFKKIIENSANFLEIICKKNKK